jgi:hypothetical protein
VDHDISSFWEILLISSFPCYRIPDDGFAVGEGDAAGFIKGLLYEWELKKTLQLTSACGALSTQKAGGTEGQPGFEEAMKHVSR